jgi:hypothetical protein
MCLHQFNVASVENKMNMIARFHMEGVNRVALIKERGCPHFDSQRGFDFER